MNANSQDLIDSMLKTMGSLFKAHPWHGVPIGTQAPEQVTAYIELVPTDTIKYELDKQTGYLKVDRPQQFSNICPMLYGLVPQTYCADRVAELCAQSTNRAKIVGDKDPLDICVLTEKTIAYGDILLQAIPIGGIRLIDGNEADDKILAVMEGDAVYGRWRDVSEMPASLVERIKHYFLTYKDSPNTAEKKCEITHIYGHEEAFDVIRRSQDDYKQYYKSFSDSLERYHGLIKE